MAELPKDKCEHRTRNRRVHMANERTFLAWVRTGIGIMAFGFVVERFTLLQKQAAEFFGKASGIPASGWTSALGIAVVALGALMSLLSFLHYKTVERQIDDDTYRSSLILDILLVIVILSIAILLIVMFMHSL